MDRPSDAIAPVEKWQVLVGEYAPGVCKNRFQTATRHGINLIIRTRLLYALEAWLTRERCIYG